MPATADGNIVTDAIATYAALTVLGTKTDKVARTDAQNATYCGAEWATEVDAALKKINEIFRGTAGAYVWDFKICEASWGGDTNIRYMPWTGNAESTATSSANVGLALPYAGEVVRVEVIQNSGTTTGSTDITTHFGTGGAHPGAATETQAVNIAALDTSYTANFTTSTFSAGDRLSVGVNPTNDPASGFIFLTVVIKYDTNT